MKTLEITTYIDCINRCIYCPQNLLISSYNGVSSMTLSDFDRILDNVPKDVQIDFSGFSEIFLHPYGAQMIKLCFNRNYKISLNTTLAGFFEDEFEILKNVSFMTLTYHQYPGVNMAVFNNAVALFNKIQTGRVTEITPDVCWSRAGNAWDTPIKKGTFHCKYASKEFNHNVLLPNGDVYICCMDYGLKHKIGNLFITDYDSLDRSILVDMSNKEESDIICRHCELFI